MPVEILETTVSETAEATVVQLFVSDAPRDETGATFRLQLMATLPLYREPLLMHVQREALKVAQREISEHLQNLANAIGAQHRLEPERR